MSSTSDSVGGMRGGWGVGRSALVVIVLFVAFIAFGFFHGNVNTGDTNNLVAGSRVVLGCLRRPEFVGCGLVDGTRVSEVFPYPLLQYLPATVLVWARLGDAAVLRSLAGLSLVAFAASFALMRAGARALQRSWWTPVMLLSLVTSPLPYYAVSSFGEMLAASLALAAVTAALRGWRVLPLLVLLAGVAKETFPPFVAALCLVALWSIEPSRPDRRRQLLRVLVPAIVALAVNFGFNVFRYATPKNLNYLDPELSVPMAQRLKNLGTLVAAPQGGLLWFWPMSVLLLAALLVSVLAGPASDERRSSRRRSLVVLAATAAFLAGLASWISPFGWIAWGPRLTLPLLPAILLAAAAAGGEELAVLVEHVLRRPVAIAGVVLVLGFLAVPQYALPWTHGPAVVPLVTADSTCPSLFDVPVQAGRAEYFRCTDHVAWRLRPNQLTRSASVSSWQAWIARVLGMSCTVLLGWWIHQATRTSVRPRTSGSVETYGPDTETV